MALQGIPWDRMQFSREHYRVEPFCLLLWLCCIIQHVAELANAAQDTRLQGYTNYLNLKDEVDAHQEELHQECLSVQKVRCSHACSKPRLVPASLAPAPAPVVASTSLHVLPWPSLLSLTTLATALLLLLLLLLFWCCCLAAALACQSCKATASRCIADCLLCLQAERCAPCVCRMGNSLTSAGIRGLSSPLLYTSRYALFVVHDHLCFSCRELNPQQQPIDRSSQTDWLATIVNLACT